MHRVRHGDDDRFEADVASVSGFLQRARSFVTAVAADGRGFAYTIR